MNAQHKDKATDPKNQAIANHVSKQQSLGDSEFQFEDTAGTTVQQKLRDSFNNSVRARQLKSYQEMANTSQRVKQLMAYQSMANTFISETSQRKETLPPIQKKENKTGLPDHLKSGIESMSGYAMDDVKVHYNSSQPAQLQALAYAQGSDIHVAPGQEKHLAHEAWHVVQQKQGRVKPTFQLKGLVAVNNDKGLENEADVMGAKATQLHSSNSIRPKDDNRSLFNTSLLSNTVTQKMNPSLTTIQLKTILEAHTEEALIADDYYKVDLSDNDEDDDEINEKLLIYKERGLSGYFHFVDINGKNYWLPNHLAIKKVKSSKEDLLENGFAPYNVNWVSLLSNPDNLKYGEVQYDSVKNNDIKWDWDTASWVGGRIATQFINIFPPLENDLIVENSYAYIKGEEILFFFDAELTQGYKFTGDLDYTLKLLALRYLNLNTAAVPRSGKARAAANEDEGKQRLPAHDEARYAGATKGLHSKEGETNVDTNTTVEMTGKTDGSKVVVTHKGPWQKGDRGSGQAETMGGQNAKNYIVDRLNNPLAKDKDTVREEYGGRYEWLHVVGSSLGGLNAKENLVAGTYDANTKMIALEHRVALWGTRKYDGIHAPTPQKPIQIIGLATTIPNTRIGKSIKMEVYHGGSKLAENDYDVTDRIVITKAQYAEEEKKVEKQINPNK